MGTHLRFTVYLYKRKGDRGDRIAVGPSVVPLASETSIWASLP